MTIASYSALVALFLYRKRLFLTFKAWNFSRWRQLCHRNTNKVTFIMLTMQRAQAIQSLGKYLKRDLPLPIQVEALHALHNLCKISRQRQEEAARVNLVPYLMSLARLPGKQVSRIPYIIAYTQPFSTHITPEIWAHFWLLTEAVELSRVSRFSVD